MQVISRLIKTIFGDVQWRKPEWFGRVRALGWKKQLSIIGTVLLILSAVYWYRHLPHVDLVTAQFQELEIPPLSDDVQQPSRLVMEFGFLHGDKLTTQSVIPLSKQMGSSLTDKEVTVTPKTEGTWFWNNQYTLGFYPKTPWIAGQTYHIEFNRRVFSETVKMQQTDFDFTAPKMQAKIAEFSFYQNPTDATDQRLVATIEFTYPVDKATLEKNLSLKPQGGFRSLPVTITYGKQDRVAYIKSDAITLGDEAQYYVLSIPKKCHAHLSSADLAEEVESKVLIPDASSLLKINRMSADIIRNLQGTPEQILQLETTIGVTMPEIQKTLKVYELPIDKPATNAEEAVKNYAWTQALEVTPEILALSKPVTLNAIPEATEFTKLHSFKFQATPGRYLYVKLDGGIAGFGGYKLAEGFLATAIVPEYPKEIRFLHQGSLLAKGNEHKISLSVRGLASIHYEIGRVLPREINHLITQTEGNFSDPQFSHWSFDKDDLSEIFSKIEDYDVSNPAKAQYGVLDLDQYLKPTANNQAPIGLFLIKAEGWDKENKSAIYNTTTTRLVLITDQALITKENQDGSRDVFISSISKGLPIAGSSVSVLGKNGLPIVTATTDASGHATLPNLPEETYHNDKQPAVIVAKLGDDVSFMAIEKRDREINFSRYDIGGLTDEIGQGNLTAFAFSDRGLYRPGETAHLGFIVKKAYGLNAAANIPIEIVVTDPSGNSVLDEKQTLNQDGYASVNYASMATSPTGEYSVSVYVTKDEERGSFLGETHILVQDFLPDTMKIAGKLNQPAEKGWVSPDKLAVSVNLNNLYGTPSSEHKITGKVLLEPHHFSFGEFKGFTFYDPFEKQNKDFTETTIELPEKFTDSKGETQFDLDLSRFQNATFNMKIYLTGFEKTGGRSVKAQVQANVSPLKYLVGYKPDGDFNFIKQNTTRSVSLLAVNPQLQKIAVDQLHLTVLKLSQIATLVQKENGTYAYESVTQEKPVQKSDLSISANGLNQAIATNQVGNFVLLIQNKEGTTLSRVPYTIVGDDTTAVQKNTELSVVLNKQEFQPEEDIELQITAPYAGSGLITLERDKIYAHQWFKTNATKSVQKLKVPANFVGNGYINVTFIRDWESPDIFISPLSYSVAPISIDKAKHTLGIQLKAPKQVKSGESVVVNYQTTHPAHIVIFAVDEGILQAGDYKTPNPVEFFFQKRALNVSTTQIVDLILPKYISDRERMAIGGDDGRKGMEAYLNPFKRKNRPPVVFWSGWIDADTTQKSLSFKVPSSFNGTLRIMAVATATDQVGSAQTQTVAQNPIIINPSAPTFVAPNDDFDVSVNLTNLLADKATQNISVTLQASKGLKLLDGNEKSVKLANKQDATVHFKVHANPQLGAANLVFTAKDGQGHPQSVMEETLSVRPLTTRLTTLTSGFQAKGSKSLNINSNRYPDLSSTSIAAGGNPMIFVQGIQGYLDTYPYECTEQLTSRAFVHLMLQNDPEIRAGNAEKLAKLINKISLRQGSNGSFAYWPGTQDVSSLSDWQQFASVYALHFLTEAREAKQAVPLNVTSNGIGYLKEFAGSEPKDLSMARNQAYAIYILTRNEVVTTNYLTNLQLYLEKNQGSVWKQDIIASYIAATYALLHDQKTADKFIAGYKMNQNFEADSAFHTPEVSDAMYIYLLAKHFPERLKKYGSESALTLSNRLSQSFISTTSAAFNVLALNNLQQLVPGAKASVQLTQITGNERHTTTLPNSSVTVPFTTQKIELQRDNQQAFFYQLTEKGFAKTMSDGVADQGFEITHTYTDEKGTELKSIKLGQEVTVHILIRNRTSGELNNIAVVDLLPGGFDIVNSSAGGNYQFEDLREDRALFFTSLPSSDRMEITYRIKAVSPGDYQTPPAFAEDMYNARIKALGRSTKIAITA